MADQQEFRLHGLWDGVQRMHVNVGRRGGFVVRESCVPVLIVSGQA